jgi:pimeloyl-ACP methyl ester carboxylesterase
MRARPAVPGLAVGAALLALLLGATSSAAPAQQVGGPAAVAAKRGRPTVPLRLRDAGSFYVNGVVAPIDPSGTQIVNQMYVQYMIPEKLRSRGVTPIVLVHGSGHSGKTYETTPDGREGWATYFVRRGIPVYVVDQPGRARSAFDPSLHSRARTESNPTLLRNLGGFNRERAWTVFRIGLEAFTPHSETQFPVEAADQYFAQLVPNTDAYLADPATRVNALAALLDTIGPAVVSVHSMSGPQGTGVAIARPGLVKAVIDVEPPSGCVIGDSDVASVFTRVPFLSVFGDYTPGNAQWGPAVASCENTATRIRDAGGIARNLVLPDVGIFGNSHMLMLDRNEPGHPVAEALLGRGHGRADRRPQSLDGRALLAGQRIEVRHGSRRFLRSRGLRRHRSRGGERGEGGWVIHLGAAGCSGRAQLEGCVLEATTGT